MNANVVGCCWLELVCIACIVCYCQSWFRIVGGSWSSWTVKARPDSNFLMDKKMFFLEIGSNVGLEKPMVLINFVWYFKE